MNTRTSSKASGYQYELIVGAIHTMRIYKNNFCVGEYFLDGLMDSIGSIRNILGEVMYFDLRKRTVSALAEIFIGLIEEDRHSEDEEDERTEMFLNPDMELLVK